MLVNANKRDLVISANLNFTECKRQTINPSNPGLGLRRIYLLRREMWMQGGA